MGKSIVSQRQLGFGAARPGRILRWAAGVLVAVAGARASSGATITVNSTLDASVNNDGLCTLREAITAANLNTASGGVAGECVTGDAVSTVDTIAFNIPVSGVQTITPGSDLPPITEAVTINGYSQHPCPDSAPCSKENAQPFFQAGDAVLLIEINGSNTVNNGL